MREERQKEERQGRWKAGGQPETALGACSLPLPHSNIAGSLTGGLSRTAEQSPPVPGALVRKEPALPRA